jgi:hypothetical protein
MKTVLLLTALSAAAGLGMASGAWADDRPTGEREVTPSAAAKKPFRRGGAASRVRLRARSTAAIQFRRVAILKQATIGTVYRPALISSSAGREDDRRG